jgi:Putative peptidoglycan binding domain
MPTLAFITLAAGLLLIIVGLLGGGIEVKEVKIPPVPPIPRTASFIVGCVLAGLVLLFPALFGSTQTDVPGQKTTQTQTEVPGQKLPQGDKPELGSAITRHLVEVHDVKEVLQHLGMYPPGPTNNEPGDAYFQAVANFQRSRNLVQDGLVGGETFGKLRDAWPEHFGVGNTPTAPTLPISSSNTPTPSAPATTASAPKSDPPLFLSAPPFRIHYVNEQKDFAERLTSYLSSKGYRASAIYDDFSQINPGSRERSGTIRIVYKSTAKEFEPILVQAIRDKFSADIGRLVESKNDQASSDLQIQLW